ncbi:hypothetical protein KCMC57_up00560 [Kitasatospora sp. CMC57]|uniref:Uncharacterized protein n=1 Tax=Kitasatospora sp. CMC57 TaxID=3231513 RepID=A0AB33JLT7_9ACTN
MNNSELLWSPKACSASTSAENFWVTLWYNSSYAGSHRNMGWPVYDFNNVDDGVSGGMPLHFCDNGRAGSNAALKNNAASAQNRHTSFRAAFYYNSGYKGATDILSPFSSWFQLKSTYNNNASFNFV